MYIFKYEQRRIKTDKNSPKKEVLYLGTFLKQKKKKKKLKQVTASNYKL